MIREWDDQLTFGAYKGYTIEEVVYYMEQADYVVWLMEKTERTIFSEEMENAIYLAQADQWLALMFFDLQNIMRDVILQPHRTNGRGAEATG